MKNDSKVVKSIKIEVAGKDISVSTQLSDKETIRILKKCIDLLESEVSQISSTN